jgi:hypothetical protein
MLIQQLFDQLGSAQDFLSYFEGVTTPQQLVSRLEHLKHQDPVEMFEDLEVLRIATANALSANIELGGTLGTVTDGNVDDNDNDVDDLLTSLEGFPSDEGENTEPQIPGSKEASTPDDNPDKPAA